MLGIVAMIASYIPLWIWVITETNTHSTSGGRQYIEYAIWRDQ